MNEQWLKLSVDTLTQGTEAVSETLMRFGAKGTQIIDREDVPLPGQDGGNPELLDPELRESMPETAEVVAWFPADAGARDALSALPGALESLRACIPVPLGTLRVTEETVKEENWAENWKKYYKPFRAGKALVIRPSWERYDEQPGDIVITLDPGMAFGSGTHETTGLCVEMIEESMTPGARVLDVGTGSGILAIAAGLLGAREALGIDIDPVAVRVARENIAANGLSDKVTAREGDLCKDVTGQYDIAVANILADAVIELCVPLKNLIKPGGVCVFSGIIRAREDDVLLALSQAGYEAPESRYRGEWVAIRVRVR